jgi:hypothetical protein
MEKETNDGYPLSRKGRVYDKSRYGKKASGVRATHELESRGGSTSQDTERKKARKGHSHTGEHRGRDKSGPRKRCGSEALTFWRG